MSHRYFRLFFQPCFLVCMFQLLCSLWLAFQVLPGPCNLHRPGGIPRIALGKGGKKKKKVNVGVALTHRCQAALAARQACRVSRSYLKKKCVGVQWMGCGSLGPPLFLHSLSGIIWSVSSQTRGLLCPPLCFSQLVGSCIVSSSFFLSRCCLGQVPGGAPFSQRSEQATALALSHFQQGDLCPASCRVLT